MEVMLKQLALKIHKNLILLKMRLLSNINQGKTSQKKMTKIKKDIIKSLAINGKDVGSTEVQIGLLTNKITKLSEHFKKFKKDKHSTLGLEKSVNKRKKLLAYLKKKNTESYQKVIKQLNLRK